LKIQKDQIKVSPAIACEDMEITEKAASKKLLSGSQLSRHQLSCWLDGLALNSRHGSVFALCAAALMFDAFDLQVMAFVAPVIAEQWQLTPDVIGTIMSATGMGMLLGSYFFGSLADKIGRRMGFQWTVGIFASFSGLSALAQNLFQLMSMRFMTGFGIGGFIPIDTAILSEYLPRKGRGRIMALWALFFPVGGFLAAVVASVVIPSLGWRALLAMGVLPAILIFIFRRVLPETPRYLISRGRMAAAQDSVSWIAKGVEPPEDVLSLSEQDSGPSTRADDKFNPTQLFSPALRRSTAVSWVLYAGWSFSYYGVVFWLPLILTQYRGQAPSAMYMYTMGFMISGVVGRLVMALIVDKFGRKAIILLCGACSAILVLFFGAQESFWGLVIFGYALSFFHEGGFSAAAPYIPEMYPTYARATGIGWAAGAGRIAIIISPMVVGFMLESNFYMTFMLFGLSYGLVCLVVGILGKETKDSSLGV